MERVSVGVVDTMPHHSVTQAHIVTTGFPDGATNDPEFNVTAMQIFPSNGPSAWQIAYHTRVSASRRTDRLAACD
jgi:formate dehydrogenase major subunit